MKKNLLASCLLGAVGFLSSVESFSATIDTMYTGAFSTHWAPQDAANNFMLFGQANYYLLNDGTTWKSGAGWHPYFLYSTLSSTSINGNAITYTFNAPEDGILFQNVDYSFGDHSAQGVLGAYGPLEITAELGGTTAFIRGRTKIIANDATWYGEPRFNYYSAKVGDLVYFEMNYTLINGAVFDENLFNTEFTYYSTGRVDFTNAVPVPPSILMLGSGLCALLAAAKRKRR